jgi:hypothetical protein
MFAIFQCLELTGLKGTKSPVLVASCSKNSGHKTAIQEKKSFGTQGQALAVFSK